MNTFFSKYKNILLRYDVWFMLVTLLYILAQYLGSIFISLPSFELEHANPLTAFLGLFVPIEGLDLLLLLVGAPYNLGPLYLVIGTLIVIGGLETFSSVFSRFSTKSKILRNLLVLFFLTLIVDLWLFKAPLAMWVFLYSFGFTEPAETFFK